MSTPHPVAICLEPLKNDAIDRADKDARAYIERLTKDMEAVCWDMGEYAPNAAHDRRMHQKRQNAYQLVNWVKPVLRRGEKEICKLNAELVARFIENSKKDAAAQYELFVMKMISKVGTVDTAEIEGNHIWGYSILTVTKNGAKERWKTQQIVNISKLGKLFNQWPSRKIK